MRSSLLLVVRSRRQLETGVRFCSGRIVSSDPASTTLWHVRAIRAFRDSQRQLLDPRAPTDAGLADQPADGSRALLLHAYTRSQLDGSIVAALFAERNTDRVRHRALAIRPRRESGLVRTRASVRGRALRRALARARRCS